PVCFVIPPSVFLLDERVFMTLGLLRVAAVLEQAGYPVEVLDLSGIENYEQVAAIHASSSDARIFAMTATTPQLPAASRIANVTREASESCRLILGGPHITLVNAAFKRERTTGTKGRATAAFEKCAQTFDVLVAGDGEDAIFLAVGDNPPALIDA